MARCLFKWMYVPTARPAHCGFMHTLKYSGALAAVLFSVLVEAPAAARSNCNRPGCLVLFIMVFCHTGKPTDQKHTNKPMGKQGPQIEGLLQG